MLLVSLLSRYQLDLTRQPSSCTVSFPIEGAPITFQYALQITQQGFFCVVFIYIYSLFLVGGGIIGGRVFSRVTSFRV